MTVDKDRVYDEKIAPLLAVIRCICAESEISMVAGFQCSDSLMATHLLHEGAHRRMVTAAVALSGDLPEANHDPKPG